MNYNEAAIHEVLSMAYAHHRQGRLLEAEKLYRAVLKASPDHPDANYNLAVLAVHSGYLSEAIPFFEKAIASHPAVGQYHLVYIDTLIRTGQTKKANKALEEARWVCDRELLGVLARKIPESEAGETANHSGNISASPAPDEAEIAEWNLLFQNGKYEEAEVFSRKMVEKYPQSGLASKMLGGVLIEEGKYLESFRPNKEAMERMPSDPEVWFDFGRTLFRLEILPQAIESFSKAIELKSDYYQAYHNLGLAFYGQGKYVKAVECGRRTLEIKPGITKTLRYIADALVNQGHHAEALETFEKLLAIDPRDEDAFGNYLFVLNYDPDKSAEDIYEAYREYDRRFALPLMPARRMYRNAKEPNRKLRIGYVSPDFRHHAVRYFLEPLLVHHDMSEVEVYAYAELEKEDEMTQRYKHYCDHWIPTVGMSDEAFAARIEEDGIDVLVELAGHSTSNRLGAFARKPAPVSVSWLGYGYTTGISAIDYYLCDEFVVPPGSESLFAERPWRASLPFVVYQPSERAGEVNELPASKRGYVTFGTLSRAIRINHRTIRVWAELLKRVPNAKLVVDSKDYRDPLAQEALKERFGEYGIAEERLEFGFHSPPWDVLREMDIGLDCFPHNSGTTLFETLYMGVPYVTLADRVSVGRIGSSILHGIGRDEWIAQSEEDYIDKLVALANDIDALEAIRRGLRGQMQESALMDAKGFAEKVEKAYREMFARWCEEQG